MPKRHEFPTKPQTHHMLVGNNYAVDVVIDWAAVRQQALRAISNKTGRSSMGPVTVKVAKP
jgi:hypothetical protein